MRIKVGQIVNIDKDVNLNDLKPVDKIIASATSAYRNTAMYRRRYAETEERKEEARRAIRTSLTDNLLAVIFPQLHENKLLAEKGDVCDAILVEVPERFVPYINDVIESHEFDAYNIVVVPPTRMLQKFASPPYLLYITNKGEV